MARHLYLAAGLLCVALGTVGAFLPVLPTVPFLLLAVFCFARSRPEWAERLYAHPRYGPALQQWRDRKAISRKAKVSALAVMALSALVSWLTIGWHWAAVVTGVLLCTGTWIATRAE
ncbi:YbaN family protein [Novosphingobium sp. JCM 18896]|uniref:YbaN family protein n=1 Tax=Novosphingobium sp. JCM 18896 TaxID=2989731 RepID=UPI002223EA04|nr:YbaN family protein [Novosphingobium sp. JCM 18896]MCW1430593.1 YbaN family protein [Novosphingobium sp. JCM 18896]